MKTRRDKALVMPSRYLGGIPQYGITGIPEAGAGQIFADTAIGAAGGAIGGGGVLSLPGAIIGGTVGLAEGLFSYFKDKKEERYQARLNQTAGNASGAIQANAGGSTNPYTNMIQMGFGGIIGLNNGNSPHQNLVKIRNKEMLLNPKGRAISSEQLGVNSPDHTDKGIVQAPDGTVIVSPENTPAAKRIAARQKPEIDKINKILSDRNSTPLARKTAERRLAVLKEEYLPLIQADAQKRMAMGGSATGQEGSQNMQPQQGQPGQQQDNDQIPQAGLGEIVGAAGKFLTSDTGRKVMTGVASLVPTLYNMSRGKADYMNPAAYQNPLAYSALQDMQARRPNLDPALQSTDQQMAEADQNLRSTATGRGQYMAGKLALTNAGMGQKANIYAGGQEQWMNSLAQLGSMKANLGSGMSQTNLMVSDLNARNQAAARNYQAAGMGQLSQFAQVQQQMYNQQQRDQQLMGSYRSWMGMFDPSYNFPKGTASGTQGIMNPTYPNLNTTTLRPMRSQSTGAGAAAGFLATNPITI
jgi:hypothetical protein